MSGVQGLTIGKFELVRTRYNSPLNNLGGIILNAPRLIPNPITTSESATLLGVADRTLLAHKDEWGLTARKLGKSWMFLEHEILGLLDGSSS